MDEGRGRAGSRLFLGTRRHVTWAIDLGSTSIKGCRFDLETESPQLLQESSQDCALLKPRPGWVEHDLAGMATIFSSLLEKIPAGERVGLASAMHALVLLDHKGEPLCDALSWADTRSEAQAVELRRLDPAAYGRTGTPLHSMAWPAKLLWVAQERPDWWARLHRVSDLKSYLWEKATGQIAPMDRSSASGTGLWNLASRSWDEALGQRLGVAPERLPQVSDRHQMDWRGRTLFLGGADGPLGNLGLGAVTEGRVAVSVGTSGAVRRFHSQALPPADGLFLYALDRLGWVEGGAISNGGSVFDWLRKEGPLSVEEMLGVADRVEAGADGLLVHPYFLGERAPFWRSDIKAGIGGRREHHDFAHLVRATLEGVAFCLHRLLGLLGSDEEPLRCTGGMFASPVWCQLLADVTGREVAVGLASEATALGAALLTESEPLARARILPMGRLWEPDVAVHQRYREIYQTWTETDPAIAR